MGLARSLNFGTSVDLNGWNSGIRKIDIGAGAIHNKVGMALKGITSSAGATGDSFVVMGGKIGVGLGLVEVASRAVHAAGNFLVESIKGASDLNESLSKTEVILGAAAPAVTAFADEAARKFGMVKSSTLDVASELGGLAQSLGGLKGDQLGAFTNQFTTIAADLVSLKNLPDLKSAGDALRIGLSGEQSDVLKGLGVVLTEATVKTYALQHGFTKAGEGMTEQAKLMSRAGIIAEKLGFANGDLARTIDQPANAYRRLTGTITNLGTEIGGALMPAVKSAIGLLNGGVASLSALFERNKPAIESFAVAISDGLSRASAAFNYLLPAVQGFNSTILGAFSGLGRGVLSILPSFSSVVEGLKAFYVTLDMGYQNVIAGFRAFPGIIAEAIGGETLGAVGNLASGIKDWLGGAISTVGFGIRNLGDLFGIVQLAIGQGLALLIDNFNLIPTNLGKIADYVRGNWYDLITLPFKNLRNLIAELAKSFGQFLRNPAKGFHFDADAVLKDMKEAVAKLPSLEIAAPIDIGGGVRDRLESIANREAEYERKIAAPFQLPPSSAGAVAASAASGPAAKVQASASISQEVTSFAASLNEKLKTPFEKYQEETGKASQAFAAGLIDKETLRRSRVASRAELDGSGPKFAGAAKLGSTEAYSAILAGLTSNSGPKRLEDIEREHLAISREGNRLQAEQIAILKKRDNSLVEI